MVVDEEPVADVRARAVDGQFLAVERVENDERNQLFREVVRAVVVGAVGNQRRQAVGVVPRAHEVVARGLRRGVGRVRAVGRFLGEEAGRAQGAVDLVRRNVLEAERRLRRVVQPLPVGQRGLEERRRAGHVRADEFARAVDGAVHMRFRREVEDRLGPERFKSRVHRGRIADVGLEEGKAWVGRNERRGVEPDFLQRFGHARVGELVDDEHRRLGFLDEQTNERRADKARAAGHDAAFVHGTSLLR